MATRYPGGTLVLPRDAPRQQWLEARRRYIGSSDIARLFGIGRGGQFRVWAEKTGRLPDDDMSLAAQRGIDFEDPVARHWVKHYAPYRMTIRRAGLIRSNRWRHAAASVDRLETCELYGKGIGEVKTDAQGNVEERWGTDNEPLIPARHIFQGQWQLFCTGRDHVHFIVMGPYWTPFERTMPRDDELIERMLIVAAKFRGRYIVTDMPPPAQPADSDTLKRMWPDPVRGTVFTLHDDHAADLMNQLIAERRIIARHQLRRDMALAELQGLVGDSTEILWPDGTVAATWRASRQIDGADAAWRRAHQEVVDRYGMRKITTVVDVRRAVADNDGKLLPGLRYRRTWRQNDDSTIPSTEEEQ